MPSFGRITTHPCITDEPPVDNRCDDKVFALTNPDACPATPRLLIKPGVALTCVLGSLKFSAFTTLNGIETDVTQDAIFNTSDPNIMVVGALSGNATGLSAGSVTISASYQGMTAFADVSVLAGSGDNCCDESNVAMMVVVDRTKSMGQAFNATYPTKLAYAKAAATRFISEVNQTKDTVGLMQFTDESNEVLSALTNNKTAVEALVAGITQTQQSTSFFDALTEAIAQLAASDADRKMIVLISDGQNQDADSLDDALQAADDFKSSGGIILCLGVRAAGIGYSILSSISTGGFLINAHNVTASISLDYLSGLKGYVCAGNCAPTGDEYAASGELNYNGFANWDVVDGHVDLVGNGFMDLLPGNGLYVDMAGSRSAYKGRMVSKATYAIEEGKTYTLSAYVAGNQRVNATPNSIRVKVFSLNSDGVSTPTDAPTAVLSSQSGSAAAEIYEYAYSYQNANGETPISPASDPISTESAATFEITITAPVDANATVARFWKRIQGTATWYLIGEADAGTPEFVDTLNNSALSSQLADGTLDESIQPATNNLTGTPIIHLSQQQVVNDYAQDFLPVSFSFSAPYDADVYISIQQVDTPVGYDATGLLVDRVKFSNSSDLVTLFDDTFDEENIQYIPPACGLGTTPILVSQNCYAVNYDGEVISGGCDFTDCGAEEFNLPCAVQVSGLTEGGQYNGQYFWNGFLSYVPTGDDFPTILYNASLGKWIYDDDVRQYRGDNITGTYLLFSDSGGDAAPSILVTGGCDLLPVMTSNSTPSGVASGDENTLGSPWTAFNKSFGTEGWSSGCVGCPDPWIKYEFPSAKIVRTYRITNPFDFLGSNVTDPTRWIFEGSNDDAFWEELDFQDGVAWSGQQTKEYTVGVPGSYKYYRITFPDADFVHISELEFYGDQNASIPGEGGSINYCLYNFGYLSGYNCYGEGCLDEPPAAQLPDPNPLPDVEAGFTAPTTFSSTKQACVNCESGFVNAQAEAEALYYKFEENPYIHHWRLPTAIKLVGFSLQVSWDFLGAVVGTFPPDLILQGSNGTGDFEDLTWTTIGSWEDLSWAVGELKVFDVNSQTAYKAYRLIASDSIPENTSSGPTSDVDYVLLAGFYATTGPNACKTASATSESSQVDADSKALVAATALAEAELECLRVYSSTQSFTANCPEGLGAPVTRTATRYSLVSQESADDAALEAAQSAAEDALDCEGSNNQQQITINDRVGDLPSKSSPYPSVKFVSGVTGTITKVTVKLDRWNHGNFADCHILLVSPEGTCVYLAGNAMDAGFNSFDCIYILDDDAADPLPEFSRPTGPAITVTYRPTVYGTQIEFLTPAPGFPSGPGSYETTLASLIGENPNGAWLLYSIDDTHLDSGYILFGFDLTITTA